MKIRSLLANCYLYLLSAIAFFLQWVKPRNTVTLLISFEANAKAILEEYERKQYPFTLNILYTQQASSIAERFSHIQTYSLKEKSPIHLFRAVYLMFSSKVVLTDNYFLLTSVLNKRPQTKCIQVWHANGSLKKFGLEDITNLQRTQTDLKRFKKVYRSFDYITVGSEEMADIFKKSFGVKDHQLLRTGVPLTDPYYTDSKNKAADFQKNKKKIILYAPTFRDYDMNTIQLPLTEEQLIHELNGEYVLFVKLHPAVQNNIAFTSSSHYIKNVSDYSLYDLLITADILITDYSSVPFEYSILNKPILFYTYDLKKYNEERGLIDNYLSVIPGRACYDSQSLLHEILRASFNIPAISDFSAKWNMYSRGNSSKNLLQFIKDQI
ncbi:CDP-glycerol glycerophosphotransferase family protein [Bacillus mojavensis]|uniref:CDP-glycerol glycerophosphotransferase family protein n=1 Tax=Bacillus mojavensis TaxID=72360 RepID=UPI00227E958F|nr:CDP-glycerol glycerophosphotransferase family protein [Bacillus mojavensis]MCY9090068.1 CDP-glycerol glycerophosphotransferase family protein [Bacillus mojavensis]MEC1672806.1 CDP-glycerol glycerophosphotransferase family protein [Bacillus mojavensis]MEC1799282.1 CDP-glycerol glycerophosphotransferase family protein [Bacillus mojavensis]